MSHEFHFCEFRLDADEETLYHDGERVNLKLRNVQVLLHLVENPGQIVTKQEFLDKVWGRAFVEESNLSVSIAQIRKALGDDSKNPKFIENLPKKGYRFIADVKKIEKNGKNGTSENEALTDVRATDTTATDTTDAERTRVSAFREYKYWIAAALVLLVFGIFVSYRNFVYGDGRSSAISNEFNVNFSKEEQKYLDKYGASNREAYQHYLRGRYYWDRREETIGDSYYDKAVDEFKAAIDKDPTFALPYTGIANALGQMSVGSKNALPNDERYRVVTAYLRKAIEIDPTLSQAHASLGMNELFLAPKPKWEIAGQEYRKAVELDPSNAQARHWLAEYLALTGKFDESLVEYDKAIELDPLSMAVRGDKCYAYMFARRNDEAVRCIEEVRKLDRNFKRTYFYAFTIYTAADRLKEAMNVYPLIDYGGNADIYKEYEPKLKAALDADGNLGFWRVYLELALKFGGYGRVMALAKLGDKDAAFAELEKMVDAGGGTVPYLKVWPFFDNLHDDPRWTAVLDKIGLQK
ncbi:MAG: winged helix-turn-helix domain-containing protein [Chloracidobacterium sp.]|nr:winged helix-turn-helix domain-containing protein [Chloracidobacterium sp.]